MTITVGSQNMQKNLPMVLAGPILRRITTERLTFWLVTSCPVQLQLALYPEHQSSIQVATEALSSACTTLQAGERLYFQLIDLPLEQALPKSCWIGYDLQLAPVSDLNSEIPVYQGWQTWAPDLVYDNRELPGFVIQSRLNRLLHGSCRKPHHPSADGLLQADQLLAQSPETEWPALLMLSGDQIYADDVAAPMLIAIHQLIAQLGFSNEPLPESEVVDSEQLHQVQPHYYARENLLPKTKGGQAVVDLIFGGARKPVFTSDSAHNHLISLAEVLAMYLLVWSPAPWQGLSIPNSDAPELALTEAQKAVYQAEQQAVLAFAAHLGQVRRVMAHLPVAMIFDDHDVTDDWNLTAAWEQAAYGHPLSKRIIGNALLGYLICQGWGNAPEQIPAQMLTQTQQALQQLGAKAHDQLVDELLSFSHWHYQWQTDPVLIVLDTRTHRWRSELSLNQPSGLMDWEALTDLQQQLLGHKAVVMISPAPMFGVKLIETVQRAFTWFGQPLMVDAENWMAHRGSAYALINLFKHPRTPRHFVILSGDVHYSFVYDIELRGEHHSPNIWQITSSGIKNEFPRTLLNIFDRLNRWLYSPRSPLNWLTKRRKMRVIPRKPTTADHGERLVNASGIGLLELNEDGSPRKILQLCSDGRKVSFKKKEDEARWE